MNPMKILKYNSMYLYISFLWQEVDHSHSAEIPSFKMKNQKHKSVAQKKLEVIINLFGSLQVNYWRAEIWHRDEIE